MTSQPPPAPGEGKTAGQYLGPLRDLAAYALLGATALFIFVALLDLLFSNGSFALATQYSFNRFINIETTLFPLAAVLLTTLVRPQSSSARLISLVALIEYGVGGALGLLFGFLFGLINTASAEYNGGGMAAFESFLYDVGYLAVYAIAAYAVFQIWRNMFNTPKPAGQPGMYGQPPFPGQQQPQFGQPPAGQPYGQPQQPFPGQQPPQFGQPPAGQPYGQPQPPFPGQQPQQQPPAWNQPPVAMPPAGPAGEQPVSGVPGYPSSGGPAYPASGGPAYPGAFSGPTQAVPQPTDDDRTHLLGGEEHPRS